MRRRFDTALLLAGVALALAALAACGENLTPPAGADAGGGTFGCVPDLDGRITADEMPVTLELAADYYVSPDGTTVDLAGTVDGSGRRVWDFSRESPTDERVAIAAQPLGPQWYAGRMAAGQFVVPALAAGELDGVYSRDDSALWLHGLATAEQDPPGGRTILVYDQPVPLLRFPIADGDSFTAVGTVSGGTLDGLPYNGTDTYEVAADAVGRLEVPSLTFTQAHRVRTRVEVAPAAGGVTATRRQVSFFFECFGEVTRATSRVGEPNADFMTAAELRRFAL